MDATTERLVDFASRAHFADLPPATVHECKRRLIDTIACAIGAYDEDLSRMARTVAQRQIPATGTVAASVWGCASHVTPEAAAFANGVMLRFLDMNDLYRVKSGGHPSDAIAGVVAVGEALHVDGPSLINAITLAYDIYCTFCEAVDLNSRGWDHPVNGALACAVGAGKLLGLTRHQMADAISLALAPNMALFQTRRGDLSTWKGCAAANASRNGVFAAFLAQDGFTGPTAVFEGKDGLWDMVGPFDWQPSVGPGIPHRVACTDMKSFPVCYHAQSGAWAALDMRSRLNVQDISGIQIETYAFAVQACGGDPSRWAPRTRETADHSLPYVVSVALLDGEVTSESFSEERMADPAVVNLMGKIKVHESAELSALHPKSSACRLSVRLTSGHELVTEVKHPKGHINNPMADAEIDAKFRTMFRGYGDESQCDAALKALWDLERTTDIGDTLKLLRKA